MSAIGLAAKAITEGRDAVQGLRASTVERNDLAEAIRTLGDELAAEASAATPPALSVAVEGQTRDLRPIVRDEIYRIAVEALRNTFRHAQARRVEVEIHYDKHEFRLRVRDDGRGIDSAVLASHGVEGHYRAARHAGARRADRRQTGGVERSRRRDRDRTARSRERRLPDGLAALPVVAAAAVKPPAYGRRRRVMSGDSAPIRILAVDDHQLVREGSPAFWRSSRI